MKKLLSFCAQVAVVLAVSSGVGRAADKPETGKAAAGAKVGATDKADTTKAKGMDNKSSGGEVTLKGEMTCAKCGLHEAKECQNVLRVKDAPGAKETKYYLTKNAVSDDHHKKVCKGMAPATVTGKIGDEGGKKVITPSSVTYD